MIVQASVCLWALLVVLHCEPGLTHQFTVQPESVVQAEGLDVVFECLCPGAVSHGWGINGEFPHDDQFPTSLTRVPPSKDTPVAKLIIPAIPQYNNTVVQCRAIVEEGGRFMSVLSENATLKVQDLLQPVSNLKFTSSRTTITITWDPPFSLNLTTAEPDIQYCVDVYNVTGGGDDHLQSVCDITDTYYTFPASDPDQLFNFTVTPRSNVEGSLNGTTSHPVQGYLIGEPIAIDISEFKVVVRVEADEIVLQVMIPKCLLGPPGRVPTWYTIEADCQYQTSPSTCTVTPSISSDMIELLVPCVEKHQICKSLTLIAENNAGSTRYDCLEKFSTYHVQSAEASYSMVQEQIDVTCYFSGTTDPGFLVIVSSPQNPLPTYCAIQREDELNTTVSIPGQFERATVFVYDLQRGTGLPEKRPAVSVPSIPSGSVIHHTPSNGVTLLESSAVTSVNEQICLSCSFSTSELTGCVGVIHSAQLENLALTVLSVERSGGVNCTVEMTEGNYTVAVFGWYGEMLEQEPANVTMITIEKSVATVPTSSEDSSTLAIPVLSSIVVVVLALVVVVIVTLALLVTRRNKSMRVPIAEVESSPPRYEDLPLMINKPGHAYENVLTAVNTHTSPLTVEAEDTVSASHIQDDPHPIPEAESIKSSLEMPQEPAYDVAENVQVNQSTPSSDPPPDCTTEFSGTGVLYTHVNTKGAPRDQPPVDPTTVQYASIDKQKLAPVSSSEDIHEQVEEDTYVTSPPQPPPPPTAETVLSELHPIAVKWEELGEALGVPEHILDNIFTEGSDPVRLHEVVQYYFSTPHPHSWEEIVRALEEIGETEAADRIVRTKSLEPETSPGNSGPPLPPRNGKFPASVAESEAPGEGSESSQGEQTERKFEDYEPVSYQQNLYKSHIASRHEQHTDQLEDVKEAQPPNMQTADEDFPAHEWSTGSYYSLMAHSLDLYKNLDVSPRFKGRVIRTLTCGINDNINAKDLVQKKTQGLESEDNRTNNCHKVEDLTSNVELDVECSDIDCDNNNNDGHLSVSADSENRKNNLNGLDSENHHKVQDLTRDVEHNVDCSDVDCDNNDDEHLSVSADLENRKNNLNGEPSCQAFTSDKTVAKSESTPDKEIVTRCATVMVKVVPYAISNIDSQPPSVHTCQKADCEESPPTEPGDTPLEDYVTMSVQCGGKEGDFRSVLEIQSPLAQDRSIGDPVDHENTEEKMWNKNFLPCCFFSWLIETFNPPEQCYPFKGVLVREHGCIFQPGLSC